MPRKSPYDLLKTNMTFKVDNHFGTEGVMQMKSNFISQRISIVCSIISHGIKMYSTNIGTLISYFENLNTMRTRTRKIL